MDHFIEKRKTKNKHNITEEVKRKKKRKRKTRQETKTTYPPPDFLQLYPHKHLVKHGFIDKDQQFRPKSIISFKDTRVPFLL